MMPQQAYRLFCKSQLSVFSALIFHHAVAFLLLTHPHGGQSQAVGQPQPIVAIVGNDITLPCHVKAATDVVDEMLEWSRPDLNPRFVHVRRSGKDRFLDQNPAYKGRTSVSIDGLKHGDVSLMISQVKISDEGPYRCFVPNLNTESRVQLVAVSDSVVEIIKVSRGVLQCESEGWYPLPEVMWLDGEGNFISAGPAVTARGPDDLFIVTSRVTVEKRHGNSFTCRVQQKDTNMTRETHIQVPDDFIMDSSDSSVSTIIGLVVGIMFILAVLFVLWKLRQNKTKSGNYPVDEETQRVGKGSESESEQKSLIEGEADTEKPTSENGTIQKQNEMEDENNTECSVEEPGLSCHTEEETHQEKTEATKPVNTETSAQGLLDGDGQQQIMAGEQSRNDTDREKTEEQTQTTNNNSPDQAPTDEETQLSDPSAGQGTKNDSEKKEETEREEEEHQVKNSNRGDDGERATTTKENTATLSLEEGQRDQLPEAPVQSDLNKKDGSKGTNSTKNETGGEGPADEELKQNHPTAGGESNNDLKKLGDTTENDTPCPAESKTHRGQPDENADKKNRDQGTNSIGSEKQAQARMDGDGQQEVRSAEEEGPKERNSNGGEGGMNTTRIKENTTSPSPADEQTVQPPEEEEQNNLEQNNGGKDTKSTHSKTADQATTEGKTKNDEPQERGERKPEEKTNMMSKETEPPCPPKTETHASQQGKVQLENNPSSRDGEKDTPTTEEDSSTSSNTDEIRKADQPPGGDVQSDVTKTQEETDKTGPPCQMEPETHEMQLINGQPVPQVMGDGEEGTPGQEDMSQSQDSH